MEAEVRSQSSTNVRFRVPAPAKTLFQLTQRLSTPLAAALLERFFLTPPRSRLAADEIAFLETGARQRLGSDVGELTVWSWGEGPTALLVRVGQPRLAFPDACYCTRARGWRVVAFDARSRPVARPSSSLPETARRSAS
jgi:hypothetical protein